MLLFRCAPSMKILLTAFGPYDVWETNASWLALVELTKNLPSEPEVTTRLYPVDFEASQAKVEADAAAGFDFILHLGQAPGSALIQLEAVALNLAGRRDESGIVTSQLVAGGDEAYRSSLPLDDWAAGLRELGLPAAVSYHAGTYLCNAALYWSLRTIATSGLPTQAAFIHIPLDVSQVAHQAKPMPSLPSVFVAEGLKWLIARLPTTPAASTTAGHKPSVNH